MDWLQRRQKLKAAIGEGKGFSYPQWGYRGRVTHRRQLDGDDIDLDAYIDSYVGFRAGKYMAEGLGEPWSVQAFSGEGPQRSDSATDQELRGALQQ